MYRPSQLPDRASVISGELQAGGNSIFLCLTACSALMTFQKVHSLSWFASFRCLSPQLQLSLSAAALGTYLYDENWRHQYEVKICRASFNQNCPTVYNGKVYTLCRLHGTLCKHRLQKCRCLKGTQDWDFFRLGFWNLYYFFVIYVKILRFYKKKIFDWPLNGGDTIIPLSLRLRGIEFSLVWD